MSWFLFFGTTAFLSAFIWIFPGWFDSAEFAAAAFHLGVSHPTGHPLYLLLTQPFLFLPFGSIGLRTSLFSVISMAAGVVLFWRLVRQIIPALSPTLLAIGAILLLSHPSIALQSTRTEVYASTWALALGASLALVQGIRTKDDRWYFLTAFLFGLGICLQPLLIGTLAPAFLLGFAWGRPWSFRFVILSGLFLILGLLIILYMPLRASVGPPINWDEPTTIARLIQSLSARDFAMWFHLPGHSPAMAGGKPGAFVQLLGWSLASLAAIGLVALLRRRREGFLLIILCVSSFGPFLSKQFFIRNPDSHAYVMLPISYLVLFAIYAASQITTRVQKSSRALQVGLALALLLVSFLPFLDRPLAGLRAHGGEEAMTLSRVLDHSPPGIAIEVSSDHWLFPLWYRSWVEGRRPDIAIVGKELSKASWYVDQTYRRYGRAIRSVSHEESSTIPLMKEPWALPEHAAFFEECQRASQDDPFGVRRAVCAHTVLPLLQSGLMEERINFGEQALGLSRSQSSCPKPKDVSLPYPLVADRSLEFLVDPGRPYVQLALLYSACGQPHRAEVLLKTNLNESGIDGRLLLSALWAGYGHFPAARTILRDATPTSNLETAILSVARSTLAWLDGDRNEVERMRAKAASILGASDPIVKRLDQWLSLPPRL